MPHYGFRCKTCGFAQTFTGCSMVEARNAVNGGTLSCFCMSASAKKHELIEENERVLASTPAEAAQNLKDWEEERRLRNGIPRI